MQSHNLESIREKLGGKTKLLAVSKTHPVKSILRVYNQGKKDFGENKVQDLWDKSQLLKDKKDLDWHFIGKLQSNKINKLLAVPNLKAIHSIDSLDLLKKLLSKTPDHKIGLFLQINTSDEVQKNGFSEVDHIHSAVELIGSHPLFKLQGLMTIGRIRTDDFEASARASFEKLVGFKKNLDSGNGLNLELSMGMSQDFEIAVSYGSNWVRIGSLIFGQRA